MNRTSFVIGIILSTKVELIFLNAKLSLFATAGINQKRPDYVKANVHCAIGQVNSNGSPSRAGR